MVKKTANKTKAAPKKAATKTAPKKTKEVVKVQPKSSKAEPDKEIDPRTGTRFSPGQARQHAFNIVYEEAKKGRNVKEIRKVIVEQRKENGAKHNLDGAYLNFVLATHPEFFEVWSDGTIKVIKHPKPDPKAAKAMEAKAEEKKAKAKAARDKLTKKAGQKTTKKATKKSTKRKTTKG